VYNLYAIMEARAEVARLARAMADRNNNQPPMPGAHGAGTFTRPSAQPPGRLDPAGRV
jgi:hypothetical protein